MDFSFSKENIVVPKSVSVDFDGCLSKKDIYPDVDESSLDSDLIEALKSWQRDGGVVILNTARRRSNKTIYPALRALKKHGFTPDYVNENIKEGIDKWGDCRKIVADYYIDDRNIFKEAFIDLVNPLSTSSSSITLNTSVFPSYPSSVTVKYPSTSISNFSFDDLLEDNKFKPFTDDLAEVLLKKNKAYGNSFDKEMDEWGLQALCIRLSDKYNRIKNLVKDKNIDYGDESLYDTLKDLAGYSILAMSYLKSKEKDNEQD